jgi:hypothetical protein
MTTRHATFAVLALLAAACGGSSSESPPPSTPTNLLQGHNGDFSGDNTDVWVFYDNAAGGNGSSVVKDCTADGFTGNCLSFTADSYYSSQIYDSAVVLDDGATPGTNNFVLTLDTARTYQVKFKARASQAGVKVNLILQTPSYVPVNAQVFDLTTTAAEYQTGTFTTTQTQSTFSLQTGYAGNAGATIELDDLQLLEQ